MQEQEIWKDIPGYDGKYQASTYGNIRSVDRVVQFGKNKRFISGRVLKQQKDVYGYSMVNLPKTIKVHRLVAMTFIPNEDGKEQINHIDGNKKNNRVENLEWVTAKENVNHEVNVLNRIKKGVIRDDGKIYQSVNDAALDNNVSVSCISAVINGYQKTSNGFTFTSLEKK